MQKLYLFTLALASAGLSFSQTRIYVTPGGTGAGTSWADARGDLAAAMAAAQPNTDIWVAQGTYFPTTCAGACTPSERGETFLLTEGVAVIGGFTGVETDASQADATNVTTLSGDIGVSGDDTDNAYNVVVCDQCGTTAALTNLTITGGYADEGSGGEPGEAGAGLYLDGDNYGGKTGEASPTVTDCVIADNYSQGQGGGIFLDGAGGGESSPTFVRCRIASNTANSNGGGVFVTTFGAGTANPTFTAVDFVDNATADLGGGSGSGGALYVASSGGTVAVTLDRCLGNGNQADRTPAGTSSFNNSANGGFIYVEGGTENPSLTIRNSIITGNSAFAGGGIYNNAGTATLTNVTLAYNVARGSGGSSGGLYINGQKAPAEATVTNTIIYGNEVTDNPFSSTEDVKWVDNATLNASYTLFEAASRADLFSDDTGEVYNEGAGIIYGTDPQFADAAAAALELTSASPAKDAGLNAAAVTAGGDYFGAARIDGGTVDLGGAEFQGAPVPVELISFAAAPEDEGVDVRWAVGVELDLDGYRVERSLDGRSFREVGYVFAGGARRYRFADASPVAGTAYYRLASVDLDGSVAYSAVVAVDYTGGPTRLLAYPNPASDHVRLRLGGIDAGTDLTVALVDATGRLVRRYDGAAAAGRDLSLAGVPAGVYVLRASWRGGERTTVLAVR